MRLILFFLLTIFPSCLNAELPQIAEIKQRGFLRIAVNSKNTVPFFYENDGKLVGTEIEMAKDICTVLKVKPVFIRKTRSYEGLANLVASKEADICISYLSITLRRAAKVLYSQPYMHFKCTLLLNSLVAKRAGWDENKETYFDFLKRKRGAGINILAEKGGWYAQYCRDFFPEANLIEASDWESKIPEVFSGKIGCILYDNFTLGNILRKHPELNTKLKIEEHPKIEDLIGIAVRPDLDELVPWLNSFIALNRHKYLIEKPEALFKKALLYEKQKKLKDEAFEQQNINSGTRNKLLKVTTLTCFGFFLILLLYVRKIAVVLSPENQVNEVSKDE